MLSSERSLGRRYQPCQSRSGRAGWGFNLTWACCEPRGAGSCCLLLVMTGWSCRQPCASVSAYTGALAGCTGAAGSPQGRCQGHSAKCSVTINSAIYKQKAHVVLKQIKSLGVSSRPLSSPWSSPSSGPLWASPVVVTHSGIPIRFTSWVKLGLSPKPVETELEAIPWLTQFPHQPECPCWCWKKGHVQNLCSASGDASLCIGAWCWE